MGEGLERLGSCVGGDEFGAEAAEGADRVEPLARPVGPRPGGEFGEGDVVELADLGEGEVAVEEGGHDGARVLGVGGVLDELGDAVVHGFLRA